MAFQVVKFSEAWNLSTETCTSMNKLISIKTPQLQRVAIFTATISYHMTFYGKIIRFLQSIPLFLTSLKKIKTLVLKFSFHFHQSSRVRLTFLYMTTKLAIWKHEIVSINQGIPPRAHFFGRRILLLISFEVIRLFDRAISTKRRDFRRIRD